LVRKHYQPIASGGFSIGRLAEFIRGVLRDSPSLKPYLSEILEECYSDAREIIIDITQLDASIFPVEVLANLEEILDENWLPNWEYISNNSEKCN